MAADGIASIGECMLELSGQTGPNWRMGFAGDTFNTLWALHALSGERPATYVSPSATIRSRRVRFPFSQKTASASAPARSSRVHGPAFTPSP